MIDDPRVDRLLEELLDSGGTPEEACRSCPELLPQVRAGLLRLLDQEVGALSRIIHDACPRLRNSLPALQFGRC
jgi:hypothetical protein